MLLTRPIQLLLAFALGAVLVLAFAPYEQAWVVPPVLAVFLYLIWQAPNVKQAAQLGYVFGLGLMGFGVFWLRISIAQFGGLTWPLAILITLLFIAIIALYFAAFAALLKHWAKQKTLFMLVAAPLLWFLLEWVRGWLFTGFPWLSMGYSQIDTPLAGYVPLIGVYGLGALLVLSAGLLNLWRQKWPLAVLLAIWAGGWSLDNVSWTQAHGQHFQASLVQGNIPQKDKWKRTQLSPTMRLYTQMTAQAAQSQLVIWPETAMPAFAHEIEEAWLQPLHEDLLQQKRDLLSGIVVKKADGRYYNAMVSLGASGREQYLKRHLVPFGEYLPLKFLLDPVLGFLQIPMSDFSSGDDHKPLINLAGYQAGINICYEDAFSRDVLRALPEADFLINASNDAWFGDSLAPHQHLQIARMRALEAGRYLLRATNTGISAVIDYRGIVRSRAGQFEQMILTDQIQPRQGMTPYALVMDWPLLLFALLVLGLLWMKRVTKTR